MPRGVEESQTTQLVKQGDLLDAGGVNQLEGLIYLQEGIVTYKEPSNQSEGIRKWKDTHWKPVNVTCNVVVLNPPAEPHRPTV